MVYPHHDSKGVVSILAPSSTEGNESSVLSHISTVKDLNLATDAIRIVSNPNKKDCPINRQLQQPYTCSSTLPIPSKNVSIRCHQNEEGGISDTSSTVQKSVHFEKLPYLHKVCCNFVSLLFRKLR